VLACALAILPALIGLAGPSDLDLQDQARQALYVVDALDGHWLAPRDPQRITTKPPLYTWLAAAASAAFGLGEGPVRLPSVLASLGLGLVTFEIGRRLLGTAEGLLAVALLATLEPSVKLASLVRTDMLLSFWIALAMLAFVRGARWTFWLAAGLGALTKGPAGLAIPLVAVGIDAAFRRDATRLRALRPLPGLLVALALFAAWFAAALRSAPGELWDVMVRSELLERMSGEGKFVSVRQPPGYLLPYLLLKLLPSSLALPLSLVRASSSATSEARSVLWAWVVAGVVVVSLPSTQRPDHLYPVYPAAVLLAASVLAAWARGATRGRIARAMGAGVIAWCASVALFTVGLSAALALGLAPRLPRPPAWALAAGVAAVVPLGLALARRADRWLRLGCAAAAHVLLLCVYVQVFSVAARHGAAPKVRAFAAEVARAVGDGPVAFHGVGVHSLKFLLARDDRDLGPTALRRLASAPEGHWLVIARSARDALEADGAFGVAPAAVAARSGPLRTFRDDELLLVRLGPAAPRAPVRPRRGRRSAAAARAPAVGPRARSA
jgi:4-amino-4-deoxy-L-arabinose transferase-like glycosyltransferase